MAATDGGPHLRSSSQKWQSNYTLVLSQDDSASKGPIAVSPSQRQQLDKVYKKLTWRLMPLFMVMLGLNYLDRTSLSFASIQMTQALNFSPAVYGMASGLFFLSYCALQVPSNYLCMLLGVQRWFSSIMLVWGLVAASFAVVKRPWQFYLLRLLLGAAEAGSFPGVWYAISLWFPPDRIAFPFALMGTAVAVSQILAAPIAAALLKLDGLLGLAGWQYVFLGEGLPSICLALCLPWLLPDGPHQLEGFSSMLSPQELQLLSTDYASKVSDTKSPPSDTCDTEDECKVPASHLPVAAAAAAVTATAGGSLASASPLQLLLHVAKVWQVWYLAFLNILKDIGNMALMMWLPVMVHSLLSGADPTTVHTSSSSSNLSGHSGSSSAADTGTVAVLLSAIPFSCAAAAVAASGWHAQRTGKPMVYIIYGNLIGGISLICFHWFVHWSRTAGFCCLVVTLSCAYAVSPHPPTIIAKLTVGPAAGIAMPCYNSVAMLGGFSGPVIMGFFVQRLGGFSGATALMGGFMVLAGVLAVLLQYIMMRDPRSRVIITGGMQHQRSKGGSVGEDGYEVVYSTSSFNRARPENAAAAEGGSSPPANGGGNSASDVAQGAKDGSRHVVLLETGHSSTLSRLGLVETLHIRTGSMSKRSGLGIFASSKGLERGSEQELTQLVDNHHSDHHHQQRDGMPAA